MATHFEQSLQRDIDRIRSKVGEMARRAEQALRDGTKALQDNDRVLAFAIVLRGPQIDELEKEIDRFCLEFLVRQQPVAGLLRFAYATIRINLELRRIADYAESIARQVLKITAMDITVPIARFTEIADQSIPMLRDAVKSFTEQDADLARATIATEEVVDNLKSRLNSDLIQLNRENKMPIASVNALMMISRHLESVSDEAKNICTEALYMCTGEYNRHRETEASRLLFVDRHNSCRSQMAEAIANSLHQPHLIFASAGLDPKPVDATTLSFLKEKGLETARLTSKSVENIPNFDHYQVIVALAQEAQKVFPPRSHKTVCLDWIVPDPSAVQGTAAEVRAAYETTFKLLHDHIHDLAVAVRGDEND